MRFYIYLESDYELDADSIEEKNKVGTCLLILLSENCGDNKMIFINLIPIFGWILWFIWLGFGKTGKGENKLI